MKKVLCLLTLTAVSCLTVFAQNTPFYPTVTGLQRAISGGGFQGNFVLFVTASRVTVMGKV